MEAVVAIAVTALAAGALATSATVSGRALLGARRDAVGTTLALARLERLRAGPLSDGTDAIVADDGTPFGRRWTGTPGRGLPDVLSVEAAWPGHRVALDTEAWP